MPFPIFMYHRIESERCPVTDPGERRYAVSQRAFEAQLDSLSALGKRAVRLGDVFDPVEGDIAARPGAVVLTFDDGNLSDYVHALPALERRGFTATFFVCGNRIGRDGGLEPDMIEDMADRGMEVGSHGMTHRFLSGLSHSEQRAELSQVTSRLSGILGDGPRFFAPPGGRYNEDTTAILKSLGYQGACTSRFGYNDSGGDPFELKLIPITRGVDRRTYSGLATRAFVSWFPAYLRAGTLEVIRRLLGESSYARLRSMIFRG